ncbi:DsbA family protein [Ancylobacter lacus]|uniref:DsbA family protein n=1 Tax=Ancylobacter lacus TaxID=2579970 RepID=UPI001BCD46E7|nr:DsbA family protein [Ancylobacter lacus]MBS7539572.1 DsbA family protein [Ancylobacter lacus]
MDRRSFLPLAAGLLAAPFVLPRRAGAQNIDAQAILKDPESPVAGNPKGDVTIVAFFDYRCVYCKKAEPELEALLKEDRGIRLVYKDWPILSKESVYGAQMALAAREQGKYQIAHDTLMAMPGRLMTDERMREALAGAGIDMARLDADLKAKIRTIGALLRRNNDQATSLGLEGTPTFLIGPLRTPGLDLDGFRLAVAEARHRQAEP